MSTITLDTNCFDNQSVGVTFSQIPASLVFLNSSVTVNLMYFGCGQDNTLEMNTFQGNLLSMSNKIWNHEKSPP